MSQVLSILEHSDCKIVSRIFVKGVGEEFDGTSVYASAVQRIITAFDNTLTRPTRSYRRCSASG